MESGFIGSKKSGAIKVRKAEWFFDQKSKKSGFQLTGNESSKPMDKGNAVSGSPICRGAAPGWFFGAIKVFLL